MASIFTFSPSGRFSFPRGYVSSISLDMNTVSSPTVYFNQFICHWTDGFFNSDFTFTFESNFVDGKTVGWTLDHLPISAIGTTDPPGGFFDLNVHLQVLADELSEGATIRMTVPGFSTGTIIYWPLPLMPSNYWQVSSEHA